MAISLSNQPIRISMPEQPPSCSPRSKKTNSLSPIIENGPISPQKAIQIYSSLLMSYEIDEITGFEEVFFLGYPKCKNPNLSDFFNKINLKDHICYRYEILKILGSGNYGNVVEAYDYKSKKKVAIKILKNKFYSQREATTLAILNQNNCSNTVKGLNYFIFRSYACISFELVGDNLHQIQAKNKFQPLKESLIKEYALQIFQSLSEYSSLGLTHCDIKPQNICLSLEDPQKIKIIDFGISYLNKDGIFKIAYAQTRYYRSPEVILQLDYGPGIDVWGAALVIMELLIGKPVFPGRNELEMLNLMVELLGSIPPSMARASKKKKVFFNDNSTLKSLNGTLTKKKLTVRNLIGNESSYYLVDFLKKCLNWNPKYRITASQALEHPWLKQKLFFIPTFDHSNLPCLHE